MENLPIVHMSLNPTITVEEIKEAINKHLAVIPEIIWNSLYMPRPVLNFITINGTSMNISIQGGNNNYSSPKEMCEAYEEVELGFPSWVFTNTTIQKYAEDKNNPTETVYAYVPIFVIAYEIHRAYINL